MSIQDEGEQIEIIRELLSGALRGSTENGTLEEVAAETVKDLAAIAIRLRNPRGDYIDYEHDDGRDTLTLCGIPIRGVQRATWSKGVQEQALVTFEARARVRIQDVRRLAQNGRR